MKLKVKDGQLEVTTNVYQAKNGAVYLDWGNTVIKLGKDDAENLCYEIPDFSVDDFKKFYSLTK